MFQNATNPTMKDCNFTIINGDNHNCSNKPVLEILYERAAPGGFHISDERYDPPKCHVDTRITVRQDLLDQVKIAVVSCIIWLYGAAGAGKSAIAQSFAETCQKQGLLIGTFFFFRAAPSRNNARRLAASLAYQLGRAIPATRQYMAECITTDPAIFSSSLEDQLGKLFVEPLRRACENDPTLKPVQRLVILDGLDECATPKIQRHILKILETALRATPIPIVVLVASRPEIHISSTFEALDRRASVPTFHYGLNDKYDVDDDIRLYLNDKFKDIKRGHPFRKYLPEVWPLPNTVESIVQKSSGQFIYAATIIRYLGHHKCNPHERLQKALDASKRFTSALHGSPFKELDALYFQIFSGVEDLMTILSILYLALAITDGEAQTSGTIAFRLGLSGSAMEIYVSDLASLMRYEGKENPIRFFHASLQDFLVDEHRSLKLYIEQPAVHTALSKAYLRHFLRSEPSHVQLRSSSTHLRHAELDLELSDLVEEVESKILGSIKELHFQNEVLQWADNIFHHKLHYHGNIFCTFVEAVYDLNLTSDTQNITFWDQCLVAMHEMFRTQLSAYLADDNTHDLLAVMTWVKVNVLSEYHFAASLGISESVTLKCLEADIFRGRTFSGLSHFDGTALDVLKSFLSDRKLSGKLYVSPEQCARVAVKCLGIIINKKASLLKGIPKECERLSDGEDAYLCAVQGLTSMLRRASQCQQLLDALNRFDRRFRWLSEYPETVKEAQKAINTYLKTHSSKPLKQEPEEPVQAVDKLSIGQRIRKWAKVMSSNGGRTAAESLVVAASRSSGWQGGKRQKAKKT